MYIRPPVYRVTADNARTIRALADDLIAVRDFGTGGHPQFLAEQGMPAVVDRDGFENLCRMPRRLFSPQRVFHLRLGPANPVEDIGERGARVASGAPTVDRRQPPVIGKIDAHVGRPGLGHRRDRQAGAGDLFAQPRGFDERETELQPTAHVEQAALVSFEIADLLEQQVAEVVYVQEIAHLPAAAVESNIGEIAAEVMRGHP